MPGFQPSNQTIRLYPKATSSPKARLNYTSHSGLKTQEEILHVIIFFLPNKKIGRDLGMTGVFDDSTFLFFMGSVSWSHSALEMSTSVAGAKPFPGGRMQFARTITPQLSGFLTAYQNDRGVWPFSSFILNS